MSLSILRFYLYNQKYDRKIERKKSLPKCFSLMVTCYIRATKFMMFLMSQILLLMANRRVHALECIMGNQGNMEERNSKVCKEVQNYEKYS